NEAPPVSGRRTAGERPCAASRPVLIVTAVNSPGPAGREFGGFSRQAGNSKERGFGASISLARRSSRSRLARRGRRHCRQRFFVARGDQGDQAVARLDGEAAQRSGG